MGDDATNSGRDWLSPKVERFLMPRETPRLHNAVLSATVAGAVASLAGALVLGYSKGGGPEDVLLASKVIGLKVVGNASIVDSSFGLAATILLSLVCGTLGGALFGVIVAKLVGKVGIVAAVGAGVTYGLLVWSVEQFVILSWLAPDAVTLANQEILVGAHVAYGAVLGVLGGWAKEPASRPITISLRRLWG